MKETVAILISFFIFVIACGISIEAMNDELCTYRNKYTQATNEIEQLHIELQEHSAEIAHLEWVIERLHKDSTGESL